jgi:hypothetical protein
MRLFAFAALLALPLLGFGAQSASADYYCCGKGQSEHTVRWGNAIKDSVIFDCDSYHCETKIKIYGGTKVKVYCQNGWCRIKNYPFKNMFVLEYCLNLYNDDYVHNGQSDEYGGRDDEGEEGYQGGDRGEGYRGSYRRY